MTGSSANLDGNVIANSANKVAILDAARTPFVKSFGVFEYETPLSLSVKLVSTLVARSGISAADIEECIWGAVIPQVKSANLAREIVLFSGLPQSIPGFTLNKACTSSLQAVEIAADRIRLGKNQLILAGGVEVLSDVPIPFSDEARRFFTKLSRAKTLQGKLSLLTNLNLKWFLPRPPALAEPFTGLTMGEHAEIMVTKNHISRQRQDEFALRSHKNAAAAVAAGDFSAEIIPIWSGRNREVFVDQDNLIRPETSLQALSGLKPVFDRREGTITAGNSSPLTDGAAALLLSSTQYAAERQLPVLGYVVDAVSVGVNPSDQLLNGPAYAIPRLLQKNGLSVQDISVYEIHEAFAGQALSCLDLLENEEFCRDKLNQPPVDKIPLDRLNLRGGAIAIGHPFGATGARLVGNALRIANAKKGRYALVSACAAGGMAMAILLETCQK